MFREILYPTDFSENAIKALEYVKKLKEAGTQEILIVHIYDKKKINALWEAQEIIDFGPPNLEEKKVVDKMLSHSYNRLVRLEEDLKKLGFKVEIIVKEGDPPREIAKIAEEEKVSLIVVGEKGESALEQLFLGSTAGKIVRDSPVPVLVVKMQEN
ncbi:universal stress protein family protein [bacterium BMS3Abin04]|nr:universal stress protein family protein [bacterium BMS3Abin04]